MKQKHIVLNVAVVAFIVVLSIGTAIWDISPYNKSFTPYTPPSVSDFSFKTTRGQTKKLSDFKGKIVILNFWATWCAPCKEEFPHLLYIARKYREDIVLLALSVDYERDKVEPYFLQLDPQVQEMVKLSNVHIGYDPDKQIAQKIFDTARFPETYIIDRSLTVRRKVVGPAAWQFGEAQHYIKKLAGQLANSEK